jgi:hypothetical protein
MTEQPWIFVAAPTVSEPGLIWCREKISWKDWYHTLEGFWFKHEQDAVLFVLRWS